MKKRASNHTPLSTERPHEVWKAFQTQYNHVINDQKTHDESWDVSNEDGSIHNRGKIQPAIAPANVRDLLDALPDYQPGPVKHYTEEEIDEYVARTKHNGS